MTSNRWTDFRSGLRDVLGTRIELRLGDPIDSEIDRRLAILVPGDRPGRGLTPSRHHCLTALPRIDARHDAGTLGTGMAHFLRAVSTAWSGPPGPKLRLLPDRIELGQLSSPGRDDRRLRIGVDERALETVWLDADDDPHLLVFGDRDSGKSGLREVMRTRTPDQAQIMVVDYRRSLLGEVLQSYLVGYAANAATAAPQAADMASYLRRRIPGTDVTPEQLRSRSWWTGKELFLIIDDYDLVATSQGSPLLPFADLLPVATDIGLHVVLARRAGGASRALHEPIIQSLRDLGSPGLLLSGNPDEGPLLDRVRPVPALPGRARLVRRGEQPAVMQVAWTDPAG